MTHLLVLLAAGTVTVVALALLGLDVYKARVLLRDWDQTRDDSDKAVRGVERHDDEIEEIRVYLAARDDSDVHPGSDTREIPIVRTNTDEAPKIDLAGGARTQIAALRPKPHRRRSA